jgi:hypothetical protein
MLPSGSLVDFWASSQMHNPTKSDYHHDTLYRRLEQKKTDMCSHTTPTHQHMYPMPLTSAWSMSQFGAYQQAKIVVTRKGKSRVTAETFRLFKSPSFTKSVVDRSHFGDYERPGL